MRLFSLQFGIILVLTISVEYCRAQTGRGDPYFTFRMKQDDGQLVCGTVQMDVRDTFKNGLGKWGNEVVATFENNFFGKDDKPRTIVKNSQVRIDLQGMFTQYGRRWANLQIQRNGVDPSPATIGHVFVEADKTFPIPLVRNAFVESMSLCTKVWLAINEDPQLGVFIEGPKLGAPLLS